MNNNSHPFLSGKSAIGPGHSLTVAEKFRTECDNLFSRTIPQLVTRVPRHLQNGRCPGYLWETIPGLSNATFSDKSIRRARVRPCGDATTAFGRSVPPVTSTCAVSRTHA